MTSTDFAAFYSAVHQDRLPFPWQERLAQRLLAGEEWPGVIAVPTACGKTSVIDVAVFCLAAQSEVPALQRKSPLRTFFVVDRRLVVDDVTSHATKLAEAVESSRTEAVTRVREQLLKFGAAKPLEVATLRGGMYRSDAWADAPNQPLVCVSTVDQIGSRLLFRGYGVSDCRKPVDAALVANDSLIIVDEAHLSQPFLDTLEQVKKYQQREWREHQIAPGLRCVRMSATPGNATDPVCLDAADYSSALKDRIEARKIAELKEVANLAHAAAEEASLLADAGAGVTGIVLNTVASARSAFERLPEPPENKILLTGRIRPYDRDRLLQAHLGRIKVDRDRRDQERFFVVATQTIEVGADLDFDAMVTEAAPLDALRQRFGRLDRVGRLGSTRGVVLMPKRAKGRERIYGEALQQTWKWLNEHAERNAGRATIDFGVRTITDLFERYGDESLSSSRQHGPMLLPAYLDTWVQTNPAPVTGSDVAPFLHGPDSLDMADVQIVWRADLPEGTGEWVDVVSLAPPVSTEALPVPIGPARKWLKRQTGELTDIEAVAETAVDEVGATRRFLIWRGPEKSVIGTLDRLRPGDTIILRTDEGGTDAFGWNPEATPVSDIGDLCANQRTRERGGRFRVRLHPWIMYPKADDSEKREVVEARLRQVTGDDDTERVRDLLQDFIPEGRGWRIDAYGDKGLIATSRWIRPAKANRSAGGFADETDEDDSSSLTRPIRLRVHTDGVLSKAERFAAACGVTTDAASALLLAAKYHDIGKCDERFQMMLDRFRHPEEEPLAKGGWGDFRRRREFAGYPKGARHEFASVALVDAMPTWPDGVDRELVLHLIGTHHGHGRALPPYWEDDPEYEVQAALNGQTVTAKRIHEVANLGSGWVDRFWSLTGKYGWWGLAYLEALLRRADCVRSREEQEDGE